MMLPLWPKTLDELRSAYEQQQADPEVRIVTTIAPMVELIERLKSVEEICEQHSTILRMLWQER
jgi:hypothetical protein